MELGVGALQTIALDITEGKNITCDKAWQYP